ncbi:tRNA preQ1(34) S-adenosylmethionine ribosyltransferase-isomerase QueA [Moraxella boevrei]|uniref:tRNA preQ1(34) S-adenosylmethionine ribosyltransferase-isomerase QueA n=1 Tax=Faucicola boevrei TaxID=346665 RepID=UPI0037356CCF
MKLSDFDYYLPENLIARYPLAERSASRLLYVNTNGNPQDLQFTDLPNLLNAGDLVVFNDTKVMKARLFGQKDTGGAVEILVERILPNDENQTNTAFCHVRASKSPKLGQSLHFADGKVTATMMGRADNLFMLAFSEPILPILENHGELPIPPYFERHADSDDETRYQTIFHNPDKLASVAAPTASLHFDDKILSELKSKGVNSAFVTLHVGAGTFAPVKTDDILAHKMHSEYAELPQATADLINQTKQHGGKIIAVGTTVTRVLETAFNKTASFDNPSLSAWAGDTDIFIYPSYRFGVIDRLITNFHLPKSTLLMLVSAFNGTQNIKNAYAHAIANNYRFFSYGDAMILDKMIDKSAGKCLE